jgi:hypothetical protein
MRDVADGLWGLMTALRVANAADLTHLHVYYQLRAHFWDGLKGADSN